MEITDRRETSTPPLIQINWPADLVMAATPKVKTKILLGKGNYQDQDQDRARGLRKGSRRWIEIVTPSPSLLSRKGSRKWIEIVKEMETTGRPQPNLPAHVVKAATCTVTGEMVLEKGWKGKWKGKGMDHATMLNKEIDRVILRKRQELELAKDKDRKEREELDKEREREELHELPLEQRRNWSEIPPNALAIVFQKLPVSWVRGLAGPVCRSWWQLATHPAGPYLRCVEGRCIDMRRLPFMCWFAIDTDKLCKTAFDHAGGLIDKLYAVNVSDHFLNHIADRATNIKLLSLIRSSKVTPKCLQDFLRCCPQLEELRLYGCSYNIRNYGHITQACPDLKHLWYEGAYRSDSEVNEEVEYRRFKKSKKYPGRCSAFPSDPSDCDSDCISDCDSDDFLSVGDRLASEFANNMRQLRHLQLLRCKSLTRKGVHAILDKCLHLESLDLRCCFRLRVDKALHNRLSKIKSVRLSRCSLFHEPS